MKITSFLMPVLGILIFSQGAHSNEGVHGLVNEMRTEIDWSFLEVSIVSVGQMPLSSKDQYNPQEVRNELSNLDSYERRVRLLPNGEDRASLLETVAYLKGLLQLFLNHMEREPRIVKETSRGLTSGAVPVGPLFAWKMQVREEFIDMTLRHLMGSILSPVSIYGLAHIWHSFFAFSGLSTAQETDVEARLGSEFNLILEEVLELIEFRIPREEGLKDHYRGLVEKALHEIVSDQIRYSHKSEVIDRLARERADLFSANARVQLGIALEQVKLFSAFANSAHVFDSMPAFDEFGRISLKGFEIIEPSASFHRGRLSEIEVMGAVVRYTELSRKMPQGRERPSDYPFRCGSFL